MSKRESALFQAVKQLTVAVTANQVLEAQRAVIKAITKCPGCESESCQDCCDHEFDPSEGYMCILCGREGLEDVMCAAEDYWEGDR